jgi:hypothetical protein
MAEMFNPQNPEILELNRQRRMAELLTKQGFETPQGQTVSGGIYVPVNPLEQIANLYSVYAGKKKGEELDIKEQTLAQKLRELGAAETKDILGTLRGAPEISTELAGPAYQGIAPTAVMPAKAGDANAALAQALMGQSPQAQRLIPSLIEQANPKPIAEQIKYDLAKSGGYKGTFNDFINQMSEADKARIELEKQRVGLEGARFGLEKQKLAQELQYGKPLNEAQAKAAVFHSQMVSASNELGNVYSKGFNPNSPTAQAQTSMAGGFLNAITPSEAQQAKQAQNQWTEAYLRFKTGAGTNAHEVEANRQTYFPQIGDKPDQIAQKSRMRAQAEQDIAMAAGPQGGRLGAQSTMATPVVAPSAQPASKNATPSAWGQATIVK